MLFGVSVLGNLPFPHFERKKRKKGGREERKSDSQERNEILGKGGSTQSAKALPVTPI